MNITKKIILSTNNDRPNSRIIIKQGCIDTITLIVTINDKGGVLELPIGTTAKIRMLKPDKNQVLNDCTVSGNNVLVEITQQMQAAAGEGQCEVILFNGAKTFTTVSFPITIEPNVHDDSQIESTPEYNTLVNSLIRIEGAVPMAEQAYVIAQEAQDFIDELHDRVESGEFKGDKGDKGDDGYSPTISVNTHTGTTYKLDITDINGTITTPNLKGADGTGAGDMKASVYDTQGKAEDIFAYTDNTVINKLDKTGDTKDNTTTFSEAEEDVDIVSDETHSTIFGKILKSIKTLRTRKIDKADIVQTDTISDATKVPSSVVTEALGKEIDTINDNLVNFAAMHGGSFSADTYTLIEAVTNIYNALPRDNTIYSVTFFNGAAYAAIIQRYSSTHGCAIVFGYGISASAPKFCVLSGGIWTQHSFSIT